MRFANGLMNESNALVASVMEKLPEVRIVQQQMRDATQWGAMTEAQRNEVTERYNTLNMSLCGKLLYLKYATLGGNVSRI